MRNEPGQRANTCRIQAICTLTGSQISGDDLVLVLSIDGKDVGGFTEGRSYSGYLPAGQHTITVRVDPNPGGKRPGQKTLTVQAGQTYSYTAAWSGESLALVRNQGQVVPTY